jgi:hypothetical protein
MGWDRDQEVRRVRAYIISELAAEELEHGFAAESVDGARNAVFRISLECCFYTEADCNLPLKAGKV